MSDTRPNEGEPEAKRQKHSREEVEELFEKLLCALGNEKTFCKACEALVKVLDRGIATAEHGDLWFRALETASRAVGAGETRGIDRQRAWSSLIDAATSLKGMAPGESWSTAQREALDSWFFEVGVSRDFDSADDALSFGKAAATVRSEVERLAKVVSEARATATRDALDTEEAAKLIAEAKPKQHRSSSLVRICATAAAVSSAPTRIIWAPAAARKLVQQSLDVGKDDVWTSDQRRILEGICSRTQATPKTSSSAAPEANHFEVEEKKWHGLDVPKCRESGSQWL